ncbi:MAG: hypothetical protein DRI56_08135 [Chloroflexota bacterium]|nr:MAG: hypothetical protein DRI56_08135 [Chloroflexota bacterium]
MDFVVGLDPNLVYLFLVAFFFLAGIAILTPGTGMLEVGALLALILTAWGIYTLPINTWALVLLILGVLPFILAVRASKKILYLSISIASLVIGSSFLFKNDIWWQPAVNPILSLLASGLMGGFFWIASVRILEAEATPPTHDLNQLVGVKGEARTDLKSWEEEGSIQVLGELWSARSSKPVQKGDTIKVTGRTGFILEVEPVENEV